MEKLLWIGLFLPLLSAFFLMLFSGRISRSLISFLGCAVVFVSLLCFAGLLYEYRSNPTTYQLFSWIPIEAIDAKWILRVDPISLMMTLVVTGVGFLIHVYSIGYMEHDEDYARFFSCMNFFIFSMLLLVLAGDLVLLFAGWEGVGLASYLLIGYWYTRPSAALAATKAFVMNRIGDLGFLIALLLTFYTFRTSDINEILQTISAGSSASTNILTLLALLFFIGSIGKSAQLPLHTWLPDAMEGPTPVSALIHAATMVTAGVYLVVRLHPLFLAAPFAMHTVGVIGGATALFAALAAMGQTDLKKVLAYSTVSQLGFMFLACGVGAFYAAMFHLMTHAFMKGLLFLSAGNVVHMMQGTTEMGKMGGLAKIFTKTHWCFLIGVLAMSGIPPLAAFFSKDLILEQEYETGFKVLFTVGLIAATFTAYYLMRAYLLTFWDVPKHDHTGVKEAPAVMLIPASILALLATVGGFLGFSFNQIPLLERFLLEAGVSLPEKSPIGLEVFLLPETWMSLAGAIIGLGSAYGMFRYFLEHFRHPPLILQKAFYIDEIYEKVFIMPLKGLANLIANFFEPKVFEGSVFSAAYGVQRISQKFQLLQSGLIRSYVAWIVLGSVLLIAYFVF